MPYEHRRIIFSFEETCEALNGLLASGMGDDNGTVTGFQIPDEAPFRLVVRAQNAEGKQIPYSFGESFVVSALVDWCIKKKISLPKQAKKQACSLRTHGERVALFISYVNEKSGPKPAAGQRPAVALDGGRC